MAGLASDVDYAASAGTPPGLVERSARSCSPSRSLSPSIRPVSQGPPRGDRTPPPPRGAVVETDGQDADGTGGARRRRRAASEGDGARTQPRRRETSENPADNDEATLNMKEVVTPLVTSASLPSLDTNCRGQEAGRGCHSQVQAPLLYPPRGMARRRGIHQ